MECVNDSPFTRELLGEKEGVYFHTIYRGNPPSRILHETEHFAVLCDLAPIVAGHLIIIPREPLLSFARVPEEHWDELDEVKTRVYEALTANYSAPILLEHGSSTAIGGGGGCVSHAHWHIVPLYLDFARDFEQSEFTVTSINNTRELMRWAKLDIPYLYFESLDGMKCVAEDVENIKRQYLRIKLAEFLGIEAPLWSWRSFINQPLLRETIKTISAYNWDK